MLVTNGCSFVWGDELRGYDNSPPTHHDLTFTHHLSRSLGVPYINLGTCGGCNQKIFRDTIDYLRDSSNKKPTHMVILWSAFQRDELAENHEKHYEEEVQIQRWQCMTQWSPSRLHNLKKQTQKPLDLFLDYADYDRTGIIKTLSYMKTIELLCDIMGIKLIQGFFHERMWENILATTKPRYHKTKAPWTEWINYVHNSLTSLKDSSRVGVGKYIDFYHHADINHTIKEFGHPDEDAHESYADLLLHIFETQFE